MIKRRTFLQTSSAWALAAFARRGLGQIADAVPGALLTLTLGNALLDVPAGFVGLSYETQQLSDPAFFSANNKPLIAFFRTLSRDGVLRLGGNTSTGSWWQGTPADVAPVWPADRASQVGEPQATLEFAVTPAAIQNLRAFLDATGWRCIYGLNFAHNTPERAAAEAEFVHKTLGEQLLYLQLGNEPDLFAKGVRPAGWTEEQFFGEWLELARAVLQRVPTAPLGAPDVAYRVDWLKSFADELVATPHAPKLAALTHHYYAGGPPSNPQLTIASLLAGDPGVIQKAQIARAAATKLGVPYRMTEGNSCYQGGKPGVSDVFASTLWAAEYAMTLAAAGYSGLNFHGGGGHQVASSLGGTLPGEKLLPHNAGWHPKPFYTPIAVGPDGQLHAQPVYYGLLLADYFARTTLLEATLPGCPPWLSVFAARGNQQAREGVKTRVLLINRSATARGRVRMAAPHGASVVRVTADSLAAPALQFGGETVDAQGRLEAPQRLPLVSGSNGECTIDLPAGEAALVLF
jgi:hypothetical protein